MKTKLLLLFLLAPFIAFGQITQIGEDIIGEVPYDSSGFSISLSSDGSIVAIGARDNDGNGLGSGHVRIFENIGGNWTQIGGDINGEAAGDHFGSSVSLSSDGSIVAIGAPDNDGNGINSGHVRVYQYFGTKQNKGSTWVKIGSDIDGEQEYVDFGYSVSLSDNGSKVAIGGKELKVFKNIGGTWTQVGQKFPFNTYEHYRVSLNSNGTVMAVGRINAQDQCVYIYQYIGGSWGGSWTYIGEACGTGLNKLPHALFGYSVSLNSDGNILAAGDITNHLIEGGFVRVFDLSGALGVDDTTPLSFSIYPVPASDILHINKPDHINIERIQLFNMSGKMVMEPTSNGTINIAQLDAGIYFLKATTDSGTLIKRVIIE